MTLRLLCIDNFAEDSISGYIEIAEEGTYASFSIERGKIAMIHARFAMKDYRNYAYFAAVVGKFDPYGGFMLRKPIRIPKLDFHLLSDLWKSTPALRVWG